MSEIKITQDGGRAFDISNHKPIERPVLTAGLIECKPLIINDEPNTNFIQSWYENRRD
ncbi:hypothetical protein ACEPPU_24175 [Priestia aryabhattai]|uniref:hypothetical protein n=1 Tax=Priestia aryabhattai TaxID=412384 RepID=UPI0035AB9780